jgi:nascent polypeptide-associated complex subunit alpha
MFPGMNTKQAKQLMKRMGVAQQEIDAEEVIIRCKDKIITISEPQVSKVNMMGQETFQIAGSVHEADVSSEIEISDEDVQTVIDQTDADTETARAALSDAKGDIAEAILALQKD